MVGDRLDGDSELPLLDKEQPATIRYARPLWTTLSILQTFLLLVLVYQSPQPGPAKTKTTSTQQRYFSPSREHMTLAASSDHLWRESETSGLVNISDTKGTRVGSVTMSEHASNLVQEANQLTSAGYISFTAFPVYVMRCRMRITANPWRLIGRRTCTGRTVWTICAR
jgi:hypothetical protein